jgi:hypothetical protein
VKIGTIGGRLDHGDLDAVAVAGAEIAEEIGAGLVAGSLVELSSVASPTMADESTEADRYFLAMVEPGSRPAGDGGGLELPGLLHPTALSIDDAFAAMLDGRIGEGARARVAYSRAFSKIGYSRLEGAFSSSGAWDTLGLGPRVAFDVTTPLRPWRAARATIDLGGVSIHMRRQIRVQDGTMIDATASHLGVGGERIGRRFKMQFLSVPHDRAKVAVFARDAEGRPFVWIEPRLRSGMLVKRDLLSEPYGGEVRPVGLDAFDVQVHPDHAEADVRGAFGDPIALGRAEASPGQSDLRYHLFAVERRDVAGLTPLREALRSMRLGEGDAAAEALLTALADHLGYVPELDRTIEHRRSRPPMVQSGS